MVKKGVWGKRRKRFDNAKRLSYNANRQQHEVSVQNDDYTKSIQILHHKGFIS